MEMDYASNAKANGALATGIIGTALGAVNTLGNLNSGSNILSGILGGNSAANSIGSAAVGAIASNMMSNTNKQEYITKEEFALQREIGDLKNANALLQADQASENKMTEVYKQAHAEIAALRDIVTANKDAQTAWNSNQSVANAQMSAAIATNTSSISALSTTLGNVTKTVVPNSSVCPGWGTAVVTCGCTNGGTTIS